MMTTDDGHGHLLAPKLLAETSGQVSTQGHVCSARRRRTGFTLCLPPSRLSQHGGPWGAAVRIQDCTEYFRAVRTVRRGTGEHSCRTTEPDSRPGPDGCKDSQSMRASAPVHSAQGDSAHRRGCKPWGDCTPGNPRPCTLISSFTVRVERPVSLRTGRRTPYIRI